MSLYNTKTNRCLATCKSYLMTKRHSPCKRSFTATQQFTTCSRADDYSVAPPPTCWISVMLSPLSSIRPAQNNMLLCQLIILVNVKLYNSMTLSANRNQLSQRPCDWCMRQFWPKVIKLGYSADIMVYLQPLWRNRLPKVLNSVK